MEEEPAGIAVFHPGGGVDGPEDVPWVWIKLPSGGGTNDDVTFEPHPHVHRQGDRKSHGRPVRAFLKKKTEGRTVLQSTMIQKVTR